MKTRTTLAPLVTCLALLLAVPAIAQKGDLGADLVLTAQTPAYLVGTVSQLGTKVHFEIAIDEKQGSITLSSADAGGLVFKNEIDFGKGTESLAIGSSARQLEALDTPQRALSWLRSPEALAFSGAWRSIQLSHPGLPRTAAGRVLHDYSLHMEEAIGALGSKTDAELLAEAAAGPSQNNRKDSGDGGLEVQEAVSCGWGSECIGCCGIGCGGCTGICTNYCWRHDICCDTLGWTACFSSCYAAAAITSGGPF